MRRANPGDKDAPARPVIKAGPIRAPSWLTVADKRIFRQMAKQLEEAGLYSPVDATALALALAHAAVAARAYQELADDDLTREDDKNARVAKNPLSQVMRDHAAAFFAAAKDLGMAPAPRLRLNLTTETDPDPDDDLFDT